RVFSSLNYGSSVLALPVKRGQRKLGLLRPWMLAAWLISSINFLALLGQTQEFGRPALWVDALRGEPISMPDMLSELARVRIIYAGEYHSIPRHHQLEKELLDGLVAQGARLVLAMEQFESFM